MVPGGTLPGLIAPPWRGVLDVGSKDTNVAQTGPALGNVAGGEATGRILSTVGVAHPVINPEQAVLSLMESAN